MRLFFLPNLCLKPLLGVDVASGDGNFEFVREGSRDEQSDCFLD
jgi:hypothetical protein